MHSPKLSYCAVQPPSTDIAAFANLGTLETAAELIKSTVP
jgi:hypothetical protein